MGKNNNNNDDSIVKLEMKATTYFQRRNYDEAEIMYKQCLNKQISMLGENHPDTLLTMVNLGNTYDRQYKYTEAEIAYNQCLNKMKLVLGENHPDILTVKKNLETIRRPRLHFPDVRGSPFITVFTVLTVITTLFYFYVFMTTVAKCSLARTYYDQCNHTDAEKQYELCLVDQRLVLGKNHPKTVDTMEILAETYLMQKKYATADRLMKQRFRKYKSKLFGNQKYDTYKQRKYAEANKTTLKCLEI